MKNHDYALDCDDCRRLFVFATKQERAEELTRHLGHEVDLFVQARL